MSDEEIGYHKGALMTLAKERAEFVRLLQIVEQLIKAHIDALKKLGVDIEKEVKEEQDLLKKATEEKKTGEDITDKIA